MEKTRTELIEISNRLHKMYIGILEPGGDTRLLAPLREAYSKVNDAVMQSFVPLDR